MVFVCLLLKEMHKKTVRTKAFEMKLQVKTSRRKKYSTKPVTTEETRKREKEAQETRKYHKNSMNIIHQLTSGQKDTFGFCVFWFLVFSFLVFVQTFFLFLCYVVALTREQMSRIKIQHNTHEPNPTEIKWIVIERRTLWPFPFLSSSSLSLFHSV